MNNTSIFLSRKKITELERVVSRLEVVLKHPEDHYFGLCTYIHECIHVNSPIFVLVEDGFRSWSRFSGSLRYPVPCPGLTPRTAFHTFADRRYDTSTEYGRFRLDLCQHLVNFFNKVLDYNVEIYRIAGDGIE